MTAVALVGASEPGRQQLPAAPERRPRVRTTRTAATFSGRRGFIHVCLAALALVAAVGLPVRFTKAPAGPPLPSRPKGLAIASPLVALTPPPGLISATRPITSLPGNPGRPGARASALRRATFVVEHRHAFSGCRGVLRMAPSGLSFASDDAKDVFAFEFGRFEYALGGDTLTIKGKRQARHNGEKLSYHRREIETGNFSRAVNLPIKGNRCHIFSICWLQNAVFPHTSLVETRYGRRPRENSDMW